QAQPPQILEHRRRRPRCLRRSPQPRACCRRSRRTSRRRRAARRRRPRRAAAAPRRWPVEGRENSRLARESRTKRQVEEVRRLAVLLANKLPEVVVVVLGVGSGARGPGQSVGLAVAEEVAKATGHGVVGHGGQEVLVELERQRNCCSSWCTQSANNRNTHVVASQPSSSAISTEQAPQSTRSATAPASRSERRTSAGQPDSSNLRRNLCRFSSPASSSLLGRQTRMSFLKASRTDWRQLHSLLLLLMPTPERIFGAPALDEARIELKNLLNPLADEFVVGERRLDCTGVASGQLRPPPDDEAAGFAGFFNFSLMRQKTVSCHADRLKTHLEATGAEQQCPGCLTAPGEHREPALPVRPGQPLQSVVGHASRHSQQGRVAGHQIVREVQVGDPDILLLAAVANWMVRALLVLLQRQQVEPAKIFVGRGAEQAAQQLRGLLILSGWASLPGPCQSRGPDSSPQSVIRLDRLLEASDSEGRVVPTGCSRSGVLTGRGFGRAANRPGEKVGPGPRPDRPAAAAAATAASSSGRIPDGLDAVQQFGDLFLSGIESDFQCLKCDRLEQHLFAHRVPVLHVREQEDAFGGQPSNVQRQLVVRQRRAAPVPSRGSGDSGGGRIGSQLSAGVQLQPDWFAPAISVQVGSQRLRDQMPFPWQQSWRQNLGLLRFRNLTILSPDAVNILQVSSSCTNASLESTQIPDSLSMESASPAPEVCCELELLSHPVSIIRREEPGPPPRDSSRRRPRSRGTRSMTRRKMKSLAMFSTLQRLALLFAQVLVAGHHLGSHVQRGLLGAVLLGLLRTAGGRVQPAQVVLHKAVECPVPEGVRCPGRAGLNLLGHAGQQFKLRVRALGGREHAFKGLLVQCAIAAMADELVQQRHHTEPAPAADQVPLDRLHNLLGLGYSTFEDAAHAGLHDVELLSVAHLMMGRARLRSELFEPLAGPNYAALLLHPGGQPARRAGSQNSLLHDGLLGERAVDDLANQLGVELRERQLVQPLVGALGRLRNDLLEAGRAWRVLVLVQAQRQPIDSLPPDRRVGGFSGQPLGQAGVLVVEGVGDAERRTARLAELIEHDRLRGELLHEFVVGEAAGAKKAGLASAAYIMKHCANKPLSNSLYMRIKTARICLSIQSSRPARRRVSSSAASPPTVDGPDAVAAADEDTPVAAAAESPTPGWSTAELEALDDGGKAYNGGLAAGPFLVDAAKVEVSADQIKHGLHSVNVTFQRAVNAVQKRHGGVNVFKQRFGQNGHQIVQHLGTVVPGQQHQTLGRVQVSWPNQMGVGRRCLLQLPVGAMELLLLQLVWREHIDAIFNVALSEGSESWVRPIADMLYTLPSLGYLRTGLEDNPLVSEALTAVQTKRPWRLSSLPMEAEFVNPDVLADLGCPDGQQQQQQQRHFVIVRKPRSVVAMGVILEKAARQRDDAQGGGRRYTAPIKMRSFAKNWFDEDDQTDRPANESSAASSGVRRPANSSLSAGGHRLAGSQMRRPVQSQPPLQLLARQRSSVHPLGTPVGGSHGLHHQLSQQPPQQRTTKLIELSEPPAIGRAAKARRRQEEAERRRQEERAAKEEAAAKAAQAREAEEARQQALAKEAEETAAAAQAASAAAVAAASSSVVNSNAAGSMPASAAGLPHLSSPLLTPSGPAGAPNFAGLSTATVSVSAPSSAPSVVPATLPSLRLTPASTSTLTQPTNQQPVQQQQQAAQPQPPGASAAAATPSYLLPFAPAYAGQMQQPTLFAYSQPTASAAPNNITVVQLVNRPYAMQQPQQQPQQQQQQQQQQQLQHQPPQQQQQLQHQPPHQAAASLSVQLTPEQSRAAAELFATANKLTKPEKSVILAFIGGNRTNLTPELGHLVRIHLSEYKERVFDQNQRVYKDVIAD
uniref:USP domain-containing protein n=1 Tax=Macrostomum lignano TaxID=282301 RepID=A0A1I8H8R2_9PLAT